MADEVPIAPDVAEPVPEGAPAVVETPATVEVAAPLAEEAATVAEPEPETAPEAEAAAPTPEPETPAGPTPEPAAAEAAPPEPAAPTYTDFTLPEGVQAVPEQIAAFTGVLARHNLTQEAGQELMDLHAASLQRASEAAFQRQQDVFADMRAGWVKDFDKQSGNRRDTILNDAKWAISDTIKDAKARAELWGVLALTGAGDHPAVINAFAKIAKRLREREAPAPSLPNTGAGGTPADRRYGAARR